MAVKLEVRFDVDRIVTPKPARRPAAIIINDDDPPLLRVSKKSGRGEIARDNIPVSETDHSDARVTKKKGRVSSIFMSLPNATLINNFTRLSPLRNNSLRKPNINIWKKAIIHGKYSSDRSARPPPIITKINIVTSLTACI
jgi:hypothetical protein